MFGAFAGVLDRFRGGGEAAVTVPPMDGALRPNSRIENAPLIHSAKAPDNLVLHEGVVIFSSGTLLFEMGETGGAPTLKDELTSEITCLASHPSGMLAIGLAEGRIVIRGGMHHGAIISSVGDRPVVCTTAATFGDADTLFICLGSQRFAAAEWKKDLMSKNASGSVWRVEMRTLEATCLADGLAYPYGIAVEGRGGIVVSESWRHQLIVLMPQGRPRTLFDDLPGYPSRLTRDPGHVDFWLAVFAPRTQLIEFVLREDDYRGQMMEEIDPEYWIAPSLHHPRSFLEPVQGGAVKQHGELKPWAPSKSYGLVIRLDGAFQPIESFHSRANGTRHGVTSCLLQGTSLIVASKGGDAIVAVAR
jgi:hypothetical protein